MSNRYHFNEPLLIQSDGVLPLGADGWIQGEKWLVELERENQRKEILGIVLPLELKTSDRKRQCLYGLELLQWLRWSAAVPLCTVPVLVVAWLSLEEVLRRKPDLLLVTKGTRYARLPEAGYGHGDLVEKFQDDVRSVNAPKFRANQEDLQRFAGGLGTRGEQFTHHELANDYYSADRLWVGYKAALQAARGSTRDTKTRESLQKELSRVQQIQLAWQESLYRKMQHPVIRQFLLARRDVELPAYPQISEADRIVVEHVTYGLPMGTRILLVDDEFDKGLADVLLQILFRQSRFTWSPRNGDEWVYSEATAGKGKGFWARFVCVKDIAAAACWLKYWGEMDVLNDLQLNHQAETGWLSKWASQLDVPPENAQDPDDVFALHGTVSLDNQRARPKAITTIVLLDLRLTRRDMGQLYSAHEMDSQKLRKAIKAHQPSLPVIMLTASRQSFNYVAVMTDASEVDGWLTKEAPDIPATDPNSSRAVHYLLERLSLFGCLRDWYREEFKWTSDRKLSYARLFSSSMREDCHRHIDNEASRILASLLTDPSFRSRHRRIPFLQFIKEEMAPRHFKLECRLVARRIAVAALLLTADWKSELPKWNVDGFKRLANPWDPSQQIFGVVNFNEMLWFTASDPVGILQRLLKEEAAWLMKYPWDKTIRTKIVTFLKNGRESAAK